ncbi:MAG: helix-turn-helix transcriptional regulator [Acidobacteriota bacterium]|nr:helix-turn-helix transcriptional regulator [Acidobacteriota bacterium]
MPILSVPEENACGCVARAAGGSECICSTTGLVLIMGRKYAVRLLFLIGERGVVRFGDLKAEMDNMSSSTLTIRLMELEGAGLIHRQMFGEVPPRVEYRLTKEGKDLRKSLFALSKFASRK